MKAIAIAALLAAASPSIGYAQVSYGMIERVSETQLRDQPAEFPDVFEHALAPRTGDELLVTLDNGRAIAVVETGMQVFAPGQRVRVIRDRLGTRVEHAYGDVSVF